MVMLKLSHLNVLIEVHRQIILQNKDVPEVRPSACTQAGLPFEI